MPKEVIQKKRQRAPVADDEDEISQPAPSNKKRKSSSNPQARPSKKHKIPTDDAESSLNPVKRSKKKSFAHLRPHTRRVPQETITATWKRLPEPAQRQVHALLLTAKRTSLNSIRDARKRAEAEMAVNAMVRKLERQVPKMPFPPGAKAACFCMDDIVGRTVSLLYSIIFFSYGWLLWTWIG
jgi:kinetochore protein Fta7